MPGNTLLSRRQALGMIIGTTSVLIGSAALGRTSLVECLLTPPQTEGPFYPVHDQLDKDNDLTQVRGRTGRAKGQVIFIRGQVLDARCRPIEGAMVEIWQANAGGRYNHPDDRNNPVPLDPDFQGWGKAITDRVGHYLFKTIVPGSYPAGFMWIRPAHVHFMVHRRNFYPLTTQMYFADDKYLEKDRIFRDIPRADRKSVIVELEPPGREFEPDSRVCRFDLVLGSAG